MHEYLIKNEYLVEPNKEGQGVSEKVGVGTRTRTRTCTIFLANVALFLYQPKITKNKFLLRWITVLEILTILSL